MKTLEEHNREKRERYREREKYPRLNGLECPVCKHELMDSRKEILASMPPQKDVHCSHCEYKGYRVA